MSTLLPTFSVCAVFFLGYVAIVLEHVLRINKAAIALISASILWTMIFLFFGMDHQQSMAALSHQMAEVSELVFFLLGAMTIVELIESHNGFLLLSRMGKGLSKQKAALALSLLTFFMSSVLDNLTTTLVMIALLRRLIADREERLLLGGLVVIAANAGGAWTPIGDVTTTMLWIKGNITTHKIIPALFLPSLLSMFVAYFLLTYNLKGSFVEPKQEESREKLALGGRRVFVLGVLTFLFVPIFKSLTQMPAYMGILLGLSVLWLITDLLHSRSERSNLCVPHALTRIDSSSLLFFLGILLSIGALDQAGVLRTLSTQLDLYVGNTSVVATLIGLFSAVIDNVPLVAASMSMYDLTSYPIDSTFWHLLAFCAGTGGSILVIGSAAGIAFMGIERVSFFWYVRRISFAALLSYFSGLLLCLYWV